MLECQRNKSGKIPCTIEQVLPGKARKKYTEKTERRIQLITGVREAAYTQTDCLYNQAENIYTVAIS
jgi:hypothetical protein